MTHTEIVLLDVKYERARQTRLWGGPNADDAKADHEWVDWIVRYAHESLHADTARQARRELVKVAALAVAAIEALDRRTDPQRVNAPMSDAEREARMTQVGCSP